MLKRSLLLAAILALGLAGHAQNAGGIKRTLLQKQEFPGTQYATITGIAEIAPGGIAARHTHPGIEQGYVLEGEGLLSIEGHPDRPVKAGDSFQIPPGVPHSLKNTSREKPLKGLSTWVVEKDKPLATPAPK